MNVYFHKHPDDSEQLILRAKAIMQKSRDKSASWGYASW